MPVIGIPVRYDYSKDEEKSILYIYESVRRSIQQAGGDIFLLLPIQNIDYMKVKNSDFPPFSRKEKEKIHSMLDRCDGLFLPGGIKFTPFDRYILDYAIKKDIPTLGVCLSMQMMCCYKKKIFLKEISSTINHHQADEDYVHSIKIDKTSKLFEIVGKEEIIVNSNHKYEGGENPIYKITAKAPDGVIEAIEHPNCTFHIGLQWHPEKTYFTDTYSKAIIDRLIEEANKYATRKRK